MSAEASEKSQKSVSARRRLFQVLAVGGTAAVVLPEKWVKPMVDAVIVPAHAAGSVVRVDGIFANQGPLYAASAQGNALERFAGLLIGSAHADTTPVCGTENSLCISFVIQPSPSNAVQVYVDGSSMPTTISSGNAISDVTVDSLAFTNLIATSLVVSGYVTSTTSMCTSGPMTLPRRTSNLCTVDT